jgi:integrase
LPKRETVILVLPIVHAARVGFVHLLPPRTFRHFHASQLIAEGMDPVEISRRLGHASIAVTLGIYGHLFPSKADCPAGIIQAAFGGTLRE